SLIDSMKAARTTQSPDLEVTLRDTNTAEAQLRMVQAMFETRYDKLQFGPVIERQVPFNNAFPYPWFDIDNGRVEIMPEDDGPHAADLLAAGPTQRPGLSPADETGFGSVPLDAVMWDTLPPASLGVKLCSATVTSLGGDGLFPGTYGFTTRSGNIG